MNRILIVEDEPRIASFLEKGLQAHGFTTTHSEDGDGGIALALDGEFDLLILDLGLPDRDGMTVLEALRGQGFAKPIILLTARDDLYDKVTGLEAGADDYVTKPFRFEELLARIRARLRSLQTSPDLAKTTLSVGSVVLDLMARQVQVGGQVVELSAREFILTETFMRHAGQVLSREQLLDLAWGYGYDPGSNIVDVYVGYLRKKLGSDCIETVRGMGYRMVLPEVVNAAAPG
ncbi:response regulator transcription factor [Nodosilinea sp. LEGE 06152]|uniref:response regulator transcription factor n=1 Tax=Nodosilinea sp. LEGE 06152 TaxID=2777966 RepID=UPI001880372C|nr:response regulator transcription factor [Nodosilinea sp. LEGE 06152]MBE9157534.1 response regulator transcription factor [Nodosilinea sp. LEGE 06152]